MNSAAYLLVKRLADLKQGEAMNVRYSEVDDMRIPWDDPFGNPNRDEKVEWLHSQLFRETKVSYDMVNYVGTGHFVFRRW